MAIFNGLYGKSLAGMLTVARCPTSFQDETFSAALSKAFVAKTSVCTWSGTENASSWGTWTFYQNVG